MGDVVIFAAIAGAFTILIVGGIFWAKHLEKKRTEALEQVAQTLGFTFTAKQSDVTQIPCHAAELFNRGRSCLARNMMVGKVADVDVVLTDYQFTTDSGKSSHTTRLSVAAFQVPGLQIPDFTLEHENFMTRLADKLGFSDINFETHPKFSDTFQLRGKDEQAIRAFFTPALLTQIENSLIPKDWRVQAGEHWLVIYNTIQRVKPQELQTFLNDTFDLMNKLTLS